MSICLRRQEFIAGLGGAAAWPLAARAQQRALPVGAFFSSGRADVAEIAALREGLREQGFFEDQNVVVENRWAEDQFEKLPQMAADLVRRRVSVIVASGLSAAWRPRTRPRLFRS